MAVITYLFTPPCTRPLDPKSLDHLQKNIPLHDEKQITLRTHAEESIASENRNAIMQLLQQVEKMNTANSDHTKITTSESTSPSSDQIHKDYIFKTKQYLPHLHALVSSQYPFDTLTHSINFHWTSALVEDHHKKGSKHRRVSWCDHSLAFELLMQLWAYGYELANFAAEMIRSSTSETFANHAKTSAYYFRQAAGVFHSLEKQFLPQYRSELVKSNATLASMPEMHVVMATVMRRYATIIAQIIAIHSAIETKKSELIVAKLCAHVYTECDQMLETVIDFKKDLLVHDATLAFDTGLQIIIAQYRILYRVMTLHFMASDSYSRNKLGHSVCYAKTANLQLQEMRIFREVKNNPFLREAKRIGEQTIRQEERYTRENRMVFREPIPEIKELEIPQGRLIMQPIAFDISTARSREPRDNATARS